MKRLFFYMAMLFCSPLTIFCQQNKTASPQHKSGTVKIIFSNTINHQSLVLNDSSYSNAAGENYIISKLKYYVANTAIFTAGKMLGEKDEYHLINQAEPGSLEYSFDVPENNYDSIRFLLGVDSVRNTSGAQTGALDPLNDMFWTWNTGYIMFKLEGTSPQSRIVNNKVEYHIGGYKGADNIAKYITLAFPKGQQLQVKKGATSSIFIEAAIDEFWKNDPVLKIAETPVCSSPGALAKKIAGRYYNIFRVVEIVNAL